MAISRHTPLTQGVRRDRPVSEVINCLYKHQWLKLQNQPTRQGANVPTGKYNGWESMNMRPLGSIVGTSPSINRSTKPHNTRYPQWTRNHGNMAQKNFKFYWLINVERLTLKLPPRHARDSTYFTAHHSIKHDKVRRGNATSAWHISERAESAHNIHTNILEGMWNRSAGLLRGA